MALVDMNFYSRYLGNGHHVSIILPDSPWGPREAVKPFYESGKKYKVLWLLHGTSGDHSDWVRYTQIETTSRCMQEQSLTQRKVNRFSSR